MSDARKLPPQRAGGEANQTNTVSDEMIIRRTARGWRVAGEELSDLTSAMVLADLLSDEQPRRDPPARDEAASDEASRLRATVRQLEYALETRVTVERAIGVIIERQHTEPRQAFERLRSVARSRGRKVHDLAREIVTGAADPLLAPAPPQELTQDGRP